MGKPTAWRASSMSSATLSPIGTSMAYAEVPRRVSTIVSRGGGGGPRLSSMSRLPSGITSDMAADSTLSLCPAQSIVRQAAGSASASAHDWRSSPTDAPSAMSTTIVRPAYLASTLLSGPPSPLAPSAPEEGPPPMVVRRPPIR
eukprot:scaffold20893_cov94-Isochrysis_galbana.AAC.3